MLIHPDNYEVFMLDYLEGTLSPEYRAEMEIFLLAHPELQKELLDLQEIQLPKEDLAFDKKTLLKADPSTEELSALEQGLQEYAAYRLPLEEYSYPHKKNLKKKTTITFRKSYYYWAAAASLTLLLSMLWIRKASVREDAPASRFAQEMPSENNADLQNSLDDTTYSPRHESPQKKTPKLRQQKTQEPIIPKPQPKAEEHLALLPTADTLSERIPLRRTTAISPLNGCIAFETPKAHSLKPATLPPRVQEEVKTLPESDYLLAADRFLDKIEKEISLQGKKRTARLQNRLLMAFNETAHTLRRRSILRRIEIEQKVQEMGLKKNMAQKE